jgi:ABC-type dipeptide/oligopeptide/nickel transport system permease component
MVMGLTLLYATGVVLVNGLIDVVCQVLDPRLRSTNRRGLA